MASPSGGYRRKHTSFPPDTGSEEWTPADRLNLFSTDHFRCIPEVQTGQVGSAEMAAMGNGPVLNGRNGENV
jgi:hypothetical protein